MDGIRDAALRAFAEARGVAPEALNLEEPLDEHDYDLIVDDLCAKAGVEAERVMPAETDPGRSELAVAGLRRLAPLWPAAAERLASLRLRWEVQTIGSFVRSLEERRPVGSGLWEEVPDRPIPPGRAALRFAAWTLIPGAALTLVLGSGCNPACGPCATLAETWPLALGLSASVVGAWHLAMLVAALRTLREPRVAEAPL